MTIGRRSARATRGSDILTPMAPPRRPLVLLWFAVLVAAWVVLAASSGTETGLLYLAPALLLCAPLILGR